MKQLITFTNVVAKPFKPQPPFRVAEKQLQATTDTSGKSAYRFFTITVVVNCSPLRGAGGWIFLIKNKVKRARALSCACGKTFLKKCKRAMLALQKQLQDLAINNDSYGKVKTIALLPVVSVGLQLFSVVVETVLSLTTFVNVMNCDMIDYYLQPLRQTMKTTYSFVATAEKLHSLVII